MADQAAEKLASEKLVLESFTPDVKVGSEGRSAADQLAAEEEVAAYYEVGKPPSRPADLTDNSKTSGIMSVVNDVKSGIKNFIEDVGMTYAGGIGSFSDLSDQANYDKQYKKLVDEGYAPNNVADYLDTTRAGQIADSR